MSSCARHFSKIQCGLGEVHCARTSLDLIHVDHTADEVVSTVLSQNLHEADVAPQKFVVVTQFHVAMEVAAASLNWCDSPASVTMLRYRALAVPLLGVGFSLPTVRCATQSMGGSRDARFNASGSPIWSIPPMSEMSVYSLETYTGDNTGV